MRVKTKNPWVLVLLLAVGAVIGGFLGQYLGRYLPFLQYNYPIGIKEPFFLDLGVFSMVFGLVLNINIASVLGIIIALLLFSRL